MPKLQTSDYPVIDTPVFLTMRANLGDSESIGKIPEEYHRRAWVGLLIERWAVFCNHLSFFSGLQMIHRKYRWWDSNPHGTTVPSDFKSEASAIPPQRHFEASLI